jgi:spoIIIJ-associated protein
VTPTRSTVDEKRINVSEQDSVTAQAAPEESDVETSGGPSKIKRLEEEGEVAADYLEELLDIADLDGDIDLAIEHGRAAVEIVTDDGEGAWLRRLIGRDGEVLEALQELTRLAVQARTGERSRLMLDITGYRRKRREDLTALATTAVTEVRETGQTVRLAAMNPFERKVVHDVVAAAGLLSDSEGAEPERRVVIRPAESA